MCRANMEEAELAYKMAVVEVRKQDNWEVAHTLGAEADSCCLAVGYIGIHYLEEVHNPEQVLQVAGSCYLVGDYSYILRYHCLI